MFRKEIKIVLVLIIALLLFMYVVPKVFATSSSTDDCVPPGCETETTVIPPSQTMTMAEQAIGQPISRPLMCGPMEQLGPTLSQRGEIAVWRGVMYVPGEDGNPLNGLHEVWIWVNPESGTWTIIEIHVLPDESVMGCIYAFGLLPSHMPDSESTTEPPELDTKSPVINKME